MVDQFPIFFRRLQGDNLWRYVGEAWVKGMMYCDAIIEDDVIEKFTMLQSLKLFSCPAKASNSSGTFLELLVHFCGCPLSWSRGRCYSVRVTLASLARWILRILRELNRSLNSLRHRVAPYIYKNFTWALVQTRRTSLPLLLVRVAFLSYSNARPKPEDTLDDASIHHRLIRVYYRLFKYVE